MGALSLYRIGHVAEVHGGDELSSAEWGRTIHPLAPPSCPSNGQQQQHGSKGFKPRFPCKGPGLRQETIVIAN